MSLGASRALQIQINKNAGGPGIFWQKEKPKTEQRKFGYKSKKLHYPLRQSDDEEALIQMAKEKEEENKKLNKNSIDFIRKNKERFMVKEQSQHPATGTTQIKPGTVTLTQEQFTSLLASLGKTGEGGGKEKISFDANNSRTEVEQFENYHSGEDVEETGDNNKKRIESDSLNPEALALSRWPWENVKKEARVVPVPDVVSWKHLTMAERKKLQWARERAEMQDEYNPWGRPGAGAPIRKPEAEENTYMNNTAVPATDPWQLNTNTRRKKHEEIALDIIKLQKEIRDTEQKKKEEEEKVERKATEDKEQEKEMKEEMKERVSGKSEKIKAVKGTEEKRKLAAEKENLDQDETAGLNKKEIERRKWLAGLDQQKEEQRLRKQQEKERERAGIHDQWADRFLQHKYSPPQHPHGVPNIQDEGSFLGKDEVNVPPVAMRSSLVVGAGTLNEHRYNNTKAEEKRKWLEELDQQREEQRLAKAVQKEKDRQNDGTWADRYPTDHQKLQQAAEIVRTQPISPRTKNVSAEAVTQRTNSAPQSFVPEQDFEPVATATFLRGQGAFIDPVTRKEQEEKRRVHLEYQAQIKAQIEEKDRRKKEERGRKIREEQEEERKLQMERDNLNHQVELEMRRNKEREALRQKQISVLKLAMDEAQVKAADEFKIRRIHHLKQGGHDISQLKATYQATAPHIRDYEVTSIPGFGTLDSHRDYDSHQTGRLSSPPWPGNINQSHMVQQSYTKDPYVEDRVLTPSRFRSPSKHRDVPHSPRREYGTQTLELKDLQAILQSLPNDVQIEYKQKVEEALREKEKTKKELSRKVHIKNTEDNHKDTGKNVKQSQPKEQQLKLNERPQWNQNKRKTAVKNSEKDPFYHQKKEEVELRREKRERQLLYLQELNKEKIPSFSKSPGRNREASPEGEKPVGERGRRGAPTQRAQNDTHCKANTERTISPTILSLVNEEEEKKDKSRLPQMTGRTSPPVPAIKHRSASEPDHEQDPYQYANNYLRISQTDSKYADVALEPTGDDFVPFMRTTEILDPSKADEPVAISRENSRMERARRAYYETHHPANKGKKLDVYQDRERVAAFKASQNPLINPNLVTDHPTARQDMILQQLSSLKKTLMQRQKELEEYMLPADWPEETVRG